MSSFFKERISGVQGSKIMEQALTIQQTESGTEGILSLKGERTMFSAQETKATLLDALDQVDVLHLDLHEMEDTDVSLVQLICATHRECVRSGKGLFLQDGPGERMKDLLRRAGYCKQYGCPEAGKESCLWKVEC